MSPSADTVWLTQDPGTDPMGEFDAETRGRTGPVDTLRAVRRSGGALLHRVPAPPLPSAPPSAPAPQRTPAAEPAAAPDVPEESEDLPPAAAVSATVGLPIGVRQGRWFVWMAVLALLALVQMPFVVLWALQAVNGPVPMAIQVTKPAAVFASVPTVPVERTLVAPPPPARPAPAPVPAGSLSGFLRVDVGVPMRITEDGRLLGTTEVDRLMLPAGDHLLDLRNDELQFATRQAVTVKAGDTATLQVRLPSAPISINARPWAEVWIDGERVGETPIGTLMRTIGRHDVVLRHPELGERRVPVTVTLAQPARVSVDFRAGK